MPPAASFEHSFPMHVEPTMPLSALRRLSTPMLALALWGGLGFVAPAQAQRVSTSDRLTALEQQLAASRSGNVELLNQMTTMRAELQSLRAQLEELQETLRQQQEAERLQALDTDSRLSRLERGAGLEEPPAASIPAAPLPTTPALAAPAPAVNAPAAPAAGVPASTPVAAPAAAAPAPAPASPPAPAPLVPPSVAASAEPVDTPPRVYGDAGLIAGGESERSDYNTAFNALKAGLYTDAARMFRGFLQTYPGGTYAPNAFYWLGESYYVTQNYALAEEQFRELLARFPTHDKAAGALLKIGLSQQGLKQLDDAEKTLAEVIARYPGTEAARTADDRLRALQLSRLQRR